MSTFFQNIHPLLRRKKRNKYDDDNYAVLNAVNTTLSDLERETIESRVESSLKTATGSFLDEWGKWFGVTRKALESDERYRKRIIEKLLLRRGSIPAIIDAIKVFLEDTQANVEIYEPFHNMFCTDRSKLDGEDGLMGKYYTFAVIDIKIGRSFPPSIVEIVKAFKPAGVLFYIRYDASKDLNKTAIYDSSAYTTVTDYRKIKYSNGSYYRVTTILENGAIVETPITRDLFTSDKSKLDGEDVLYGAFSHDRQYFNLMSIVTGALNYSFSVDTTLADVKKDLGEAPIDFYVNTSPRIGGNATLNVEARSESSVITAYNIFDYLATYNTRDLSQLKKVQPSATKEELMLTLVDSLTIHAKLKTNTSPSVVAPVSLDIYNFEENMWKTVGIVNANYQVQSLDSESINATNVVNNNGLLFCRLTLQNKENVPIEFAISSLYAYSSCDVGYGVELQSGATLAKQETHVSPLQ